MVNSFVTEEDLEDCTRFAENYKLWCNLPVYETFSNHESLFYEDSVVLQEPEHGSISIE